MYYNLDLFGKEVCRIRNSLGYTQKYVCDLSTISIDTMRKIENGKVTPNQITLELLSIVLKADLNMLLLNYRLDNYGNFIKLKNRIESKLERGEFGSLMDDLNILKNMIYNEKPNIYIENLLKQLCLLVESVNIKINDDNYSEALNRLIKAMELTTPSFNLSSYDNYVYSSMEVRILMNIGLLYNKLESTNKGLEILEFCLEALDSNEIDFKIKILYNLAYNCYRLDLHDKALYYSNLGIDTCVANNSLTCLSLLYSRKAISEYYLDCDVYKDTLMKAMTLFDITKQKMLKDMFLKSCENIHNIKIF